MMPGGLGGGCDAVYKRYRLDEILEGPFSYKLAGFQVPFRVALEGFFNFGRVQFRCHEQYLASVMLAALFAPCNRRMSTAYRSGRQLSELRAQLGPCFVWHREKHFNDLRVELLSGTSNNLFFGCVERCSLAIGPVRSHRVQRIGDREDACAEG